MKKIVFFILGIFFFILGIIGVLLPVVPQVPFFLLSCFCFMRSSKVVHGWFIQSRLYQKYLKDIVEKKAIRRKDKIMFVCSFTVTTGIGIFFLRDIKAAVISLVVFWLIYVIYFIFILKTL